MPDSSLDEDSRCPSNPIVCQPASTVSDITGIGTVMLSLWFVDCGSHGASILMAL